MNESLATLLLFKADDLGDAGSETAKGGDQQPEPPPVTHRLISQDYRYDKKCEPCSERADGAFPTAALFLLFRRLVFAGEMRREFVVGPFFRTKSSPSP